MYSSANDSVLDDQRYNYTTRTNQKMEVVEKVYVRALLQCML